MRRLSKEESRRRWRELRMITNEWDPIGVMKSEDWPRDEYECLVGPVMRLLERDASVAEIADYLRGEIEQHFGLDPRHHDFAAVATKMKEWFQMSWARSIV